MAKLSQSVVEHAIRRLSDSGLQKAQASAVECWLVGSVLAGRQLYPTIGLVNEVVRELFVLFPEHPEGRINLFRPIDSLKWGDVKDSGRKTVWNNGTRLWASSLFKGNHFQNGLREDSALILDGKLGSHRPPRTALCVYLLREKELPANTNITDLTSVVQTSIGIRADDFMAVTSPDDFGEDLFGNSTWQASNLSVDLRPRIERAQSGPISDSDIRVEIEDVQDQNALEYGIDEARVEFESSEADVEIEETGEDSTDIRPWNPSSIRVEPRSYSIRNMLDMIDEGEIELDPSFQRRRVWKPIQKSLLIESILLRIPLPTFYFSASDSGTLQVIDGLQRLSTIHDFVRGRKFKLSSLEYLSGQLPGLTFDELRDTVWGRRIHSTQIQANIVDPQTPPPVKLNIFGRINTQGTPLSQQELRHAMSGDRSRHLLTELAESLHFNEATNFALWKHPRMADREVVLRFCSFDIMSDLSDYNGRLNDLLTTTTSVLDASSTLDLQISLIRSRFEQAMNNAITIFGRHGFRKSIGGRFGPLSRPLFDVWSYYLGRMTEDSVQEAKSRIQSEYSSLFEDESYVESITYSTANQQGVLYRFKRTKMFLEDIGITLEPGFL